MTSGSGSDLVRLKSVIGASQMRSRWVDANAIHSPCRIPGETCCQLVEIKMLCYELSSKFSDSY